MRFSDIVLGFTDQAQILKKNKASSDCQEFCYKGMDAIGLDKKKKAAAEKWFCDNDGFFFNFSIFSHLKNSFSCFLHFK